MQRESSITSVSPNDKAINSTASRKQSRDLRTIAMLLTLIPGAMIAGTLAAPDIASAASFRCERVEISDGYASTTCTIRSGEVRLRNDCNKWNDKYSTWKGRGKHRLVTGKCSQSWGTAGSRGGIIETRN